MPGLADIKQRLLGFFEAIGERAKKVTLPFFDHVPLYDVGLFFWRGIVDGSITTRASAAAFNFILAMFPAIIFLFTVIPYIPIPNFQEELLMLIETVVPHTAYLAIEGTVEDIVMQPHGGMLSFGFLAALIFATNGIDSLISAFNATVHVMETRSWLNQRFVALILVLILTLLMTSGIALITIGQGLMEFLVEKAILKKDLVYYLLQSVKWIVICALFFFAYAFLFYLAPSKKSKFRFISAGGTLASILSIMTSVGFSFYINNFGAYNKLYGSIGTLVVVMLWVYFMSLILLIGFELNASISTAGEQNILSVSNEIEEIDEL